MMFYIDTNKWYNKVCLWIGKVFCVLWYVISGPFRMVRYIKDVLSYNRYEKRNKNL